MPSIGIRQMDDLSSSRTNKGAASSYRPQERVYEYVTCVLTREFDSFQAPRKPVNDTVTVIFPG